MPNTKRALKTKDILRATGITHQILYRYVTMGLVVELETRETGHRVFPPETIGVIKLVQRLNQSGYTLRDIKEIFFKENRLRRIQRGWPKRQSPGEQSRQPAFQEKPSSTEH